MTRDDIVGGTVSHTVTITGSRHTGHRALAEYALLFDAYLRPFAGEGSHFYLGGALGVDTLALDWLAEHTPAALTVVVPCLSNTRAGAPTVRTAVPKLRRLVNLTRGERTITGFTQGSGTGHLQELLDEYLDVQSSEMNPPQSFARKHQL